MSDTMVPRICISVLNWNSHTHTIRCLKSLQDLDYDNCHIVVVDNASSDGSVTMIRTTFPDVHIVCSETNLGYVGGHELALQWALATQEFDLFLLLNNDVVVASDTLNHLVDAYRQHGDALYGSVALNAESEHNDWVMAMALWKFRADNRTLYFHTYHGLAYSVSFETTTPCLTPALHGSSLLIPLSVIRNYGFMDTDFFLYSEESDYCLRLRENGIHSFLVPASVIYHVGGGSGRGTARLKAIIRYYRIRNRLILLNRHSTYRSYLRQIIYSLLFAAKNVAFGIVNRNKALEGYYALVAVRDALLGRRGKTLAPEDGLLQVGKG